MNVEKNSLNGISKNLAGFQIAEHTRNRRNIIDHGKQPGIMQIRNQSMEIEQKAFEAFMLAYHEHGGTGLGFRKCLAAYEAAKQSTQQPDLSITDRNKIAVYNAEIEGAKRGLSTQNLSYDEAHGHNWKENPTKTSEEK